MAENKFKRIFIALNLPANSIAEVQKIEERLKPQLRGVKWVNSDNFHITLHFLGDLEDEGINKVKLTLQSLSGRFAQMQFKLGGLGAFPTLTQARIIFLACEQINGNFVIKLQNLIGEKLKTIGLAVDERAWKPHITLGRAKDSAISAAKVKDIASIATFKVASFDLLESILTPAGPIYKTIEKFELINNGKSDH